MSDTCRPSAFPDPRRTPTLSILEAGEWLGVGKAAAYEAARTGALPTVRVGHHKLRVPTAALARLLELDLEGGSRVDDGAPAAS